MTKPSRGTRRLSRPVVLVVAIASVVLSALGVQFMRRDLHVTLTDGRSVSALANTDRPTVVLVYDPGTCFACVASVHQLRTIERRGDISLQLVLTRPPTDRERFRLATVRLRPAGVARSPVLSSLTQREILLTGKRIVWETRAPNIGMKSRMLEHVATLTTASHSRNRG
jgi:hypothetical protein